MKRFLSGFQAAFFPLSLRTILLLGCLWLPIGFTLGTQTLLGPVRWITEAVRKSGGEEDLLVRLVIVLYVPVSFLVALLFTRTVIRSSRREVRIAVPVLCYLAMGAVLFFWLNPQLFPQGKRPDLSSPTERFTIGPYPTAEQMAELKANGYTAVVSLLHPAVVPFEPKLLADEKKTAAEAGIELIHLPMLPWVSENREVLDQLRTLARDGTGRYYLHCYLGRDRVRVAQRIIEETGASTRSLGASAETIVQTLDTLDSLERGTIYTLDDNVFLTPFPTDEEYFAFLVASGIKTVINVMDTENPRNDTWLKRERELTARYGIDLHEIRMHAAPFEPASALEAARKARALPRPLAVHGFQSPSYRTEAIILAYVTGLPPVPSTLLSRKLGVGPVTLAAPNVAMGGRPRIYGDYGELMRAGVKTFVYVGPATDKDAAYDASFTERAGGIAWEAFDPPSADALIDKVAVDGPWYLYGPALEPLRETLVAKLGPASPDERLAAYREKAAKAKPVAAAVTPEPPPPADEAHGGGPVAVVIAFLERAMPAPQLIILLGPFCLLYAVLGAMFAGWLRMEKGVRTPYTRKIFHFTIFTMAGVLQLAAGLPAVVLYGSITSLCVLYAVLRGKGFPFYEAMARPTDEPHRTFYILVPLVTTALGGVLANLFFGVFAPIGYLVGGWGDAVGEPVGSRWGKHRYRVPSLLGVPAQRSVEGSSAVFLVGFTAALLGLLAQGVAPALALKVAAACALLATLVEAVSTHGLDNLTIQLAAAGAAWWFLR